MAALSAHLWLGFHALLKKESQEDLYHFLAECKTSERSPMDIIFYVLLLLKGYILHPITISF